MEKILAFNASVGIRDLDRQLHREGFQVRFLDATTTTNFQFLEASAAVVIGVHNEWAEIAQNLCFEARRSDQDVWILVISPRTDAATKARFLDLGADDYMEEPVAAEELIARLRGAIRRRTARANGASV